ncbi:MAG: response regulator [Deltaproteobacteria bacterium]|nr:response regulator [Deltaproteobacteria bacterium]
MALILIIDDETEIREVLRQILERAGYEVMEASDGREGINLYRERQADLIITDIVMPKKDGLETITDLRIEFPGSKIIAISGGGRLDPKPYLELAEGFGADRLLTKPFGHEELLEAVQDLLGRSDT